MMYNIDCLAESRFLVIPEGRRLNPMSCDAPLSTEDWDDNGAAEYKTKTMFAHIKSEDMVLQRPE